MESGIWALGRGDWQWVEGILVEGAVEADFIFGLASTGRAKLMGQFGKLVGFDRWLGAADLVDTADRLFAACC